MVAPSKIGVYEIIFVAGIKVRSLLSAFSSGSQMMIWQVHYSVAILWNQGWELLSKIHVKFDFCQQGISNMASDWLAAVLPVN